jgi:hypothetical protein
MLEELPTLMALAALAVEEHPHAQQLSQRLWPFSLQPCADFEDDALRESPLTNDD